MISYKRLKIFVIFWLFSLLFVEIFLFRLQIAEIFLSPTKANILKERGIIYDRWGRELVYNVKRKSLAINPSNISMEEKNKIAERLSKDLDIPKSIILDKLNTKTSFVWIKRILSPSEVNRIQDLISENKIFFKEEPYRTYPLSLATSPLLGLAGVDNQGLYGLEAVLDSWLKDGKNVYLTIDKDLQSICANYLKDGIERFDAKGGSIGIIDVGSGEILAFAIMPDFDIKESLSDLVKKLQDNYPLNAVFEPGSVFKIMTTIIALEENLVDPNEEINCEGKEEINGHIIQCTKKHGRVNLEKAIVESCNIYFYKLSQKISADLWYKYLRLFNLDAPLQGDLIINPKDFLIPNLKESDFTRGTIGFGQGIAFSPIKLLWSFSSIANDGWLNQLHWIKRIEDSTGNVIFENSPVRLLQVISPKTSKKVLEYLVKVVKEGTANNLKLEGYKVAGKTGTAQVSGKNGYKEGAYNHFFLGYLFLPEKTYAIIIMLQEPKKGNYARETVVPIFGEIVKRLAIYGRMRE
ncbi:MAG: peptidoglycan D,D-transpeptidase FtsI family protein [Dictyoglomaceae bacterium]